MRVSRITWTVIVVEAALAAIGLVVSWLIGTPIMEITRVDLQSGLLAVAVTVPLLAVVIRWVYAKLR